MTTKDPFTITVMELFGTDPLASSARAQRIVAAAQARVVRADALLAGRRVRTKFHIRTVAEFNAEVQNLLSSLDIAPSAAGYEYREELATLAMHLDDEVNPAPVDLPLEYSGRERGEFDSQTVGVRNRGE